MAARKSKRGGARAGAGRKALSDTGAALNQWSGRLDRAKLRKLAELRGVSESEAVRDAIEARLDGLAARRRSMSHRDIMAQIDFEADGG